MAVIGLTGGIACGKSAVVALLRARGVAVVDADVVARDVVAPGTEGLAAVVEAFGPDVVLPSGELDRKSLGAKVFGDPEARRRLNAILHPRIGAESAARLGALTAAGHPFVVYDAALLVENGIHRALDGLIVVSTTPALQRARLIARDGCTPLEAEARIAAQMPLDAKRAAADWVIDNDTDRATLATRVAALYETLVARFGPPAAQFTQEGRA